MEAKETKSKNTIAFSHCPQCGRFPTQIIATVNGNVYVAVDLKGFAAETECNKCNGVNHKFQIEDVKLTSKEADPKPIVDGRTKYPFKSLQPGKCFYIPPETRTGQWRKAFTALWAYNRRHKAKLTFKRMPDGRLCIFYPLDLEFDEPRPSQFEFVSWLTTLTEATSLDLRNVNQPHETLAEWFDEFVSKSGKAMKYEINESSQIMTIEVL